MSYIYIYRERERQTDRQRYGTCCEELKKELVLYELIFPHIMWQCIVCKMWTKQHRGVMDPIKRKKNSITVSKIYTVESTDVAK
jgi:hypothetical protein